MARRSACKGSRCRTAEFQLRPEAGGITSYRRQADRRAGRGSWRHRYRNKQCYGPARKRSRARRGQTCTQGPAKPRRLHSLSHPRRRHLYSARPARAHRAQLQRRPFRFYPRRLQSQFICLRRIGLHAVKTPVPTRKPPHSRRRKTSPTSSPASTCRTKTAPSLQSSSISRSATR